MVKTTTKHPADQDEQHLCLLEAIKLVILFPLALIRFVLLFVLFVFVCVVILPVILLAPRNSKAPLRFVQYVWRCVSRIFLILFGVYHIPTYGEKQFTSYANNQKVVFVANHSSYFDAWVSCVTIPIPTAGVSKIGVKKVPVLGAVLDFMQFCWINHVQTGQGGSSVILEHVKDPSKPHLILAPEGTTTNGQSILKFRTGAFVIGHPVQPYVLCYPSRFFAPMFGGVSRLFLFYRQLCSIYTPCHVIILPVFIPTQSDISDPSAFAERVRIAMSDVSGKPLCDLTGVELLTNQTSKVDPLIRYQFQWWSLFPKK
eukprot:c6019_g1_i1.p1 GENE.c6019_g1_i1~~c6019_g1_i1.p1  ORF type:complete len:314 (-),score=62.33 c6019_g1_i1:336-1277(-)